MLTDGHLLMKDNELSHAIYPSIREQKNGNEENKSARQKTSRLKASNSPQFPYPATHCRFKSSFWNPGSGSVRGHSPGE